MGGERGPRHKAPCLLPLGSPLEPRLHIYRCGQGEAGHLDTSVLTGSCRRDVTAKHRALLDSPGLPPPARDPPTLTWPLSSGPQSHLGRSHDPGNKATAQAHWPPPGRGHSTCKGTEAWRRANRSPRSLSAWWGRGRRCSTAPPVSSLHSHVIHTWPGQGPPARSPCPASACALPHLSSGLHLSPTSSRPGPFHLWGWGGERRAPEGVTGCHRVWQQPQDRGYLSSEAVALRSSPFHPLQVPHPRCPHWLSKQSSVEDRGGCDGCRVMGDFGKVEGDAELGQA